MFQYEAKSVVDRYHDLLKQAWAEPSDLSLLTLIHYPVDRDRLDIFRRFPILRELNPQVETRTAELTPMMVQLVASGRGVTRSPNWAVSEYLDSETIDGRPPG